ncbi:hypothetical protein NWE55_16815 (plasmid) [Myroides albus]|uniref:Uncharacterized protein n=1 Tax=Myroides odoratimimus TaxID=76832 RepID=A0AAI8C9K5_9FLAO|nr:MULTISPECIES: hypothetical protein [Myroides]ALU28485.1 hypothetical protein AS202_20110 [Myroides odoratimimus]UVD81423.1 hypothetical protein NWE55_16815 [Myroides albus]
MIRKGILIIVLFVLLKYLGSLVLIVIEAVFNGFLYTLKDILIEGNLSLEAFSRFGKMTLYVVGLLLAVLVPLYYVAKKIYSFLYIKFLYFKIKLNEFGNR